MVNSFVFLTPNYSAMFVSRLLLVDEANEALATSEISIRLAIPERAFKTFVILLAIGDLSA